MTQAADAALSVILIGNFPPRRCGIATFTADLHKALIGLAGASVSVAAMDDGDGATYGPPVARVVRQEERADYAELGREMARMADVILLQHEFGIFGGEAGAYVLDALEVNDVPLVVTLHTVLARPSPAQRRVMERLIARAARLVVMAERGLQILRRVYGVPAAKISLVPHGIPDRPYIRPAAKRARLGWDERPTLLTFGLLSPNKGIETVIDALPSLIADTPNLRYVVLGATHPHLLRDEGERYRRSLERRALTLGVARHVAFANRFLELGELCDHLQAADIYVTPYRSREQITSGTLSYAYGLGRPIVSTPYWHAEELLGDRPGQLVAFDDARAMAAALGRLLTDEALRNEVAREAYERARAFLWPRIGAHYAAILGAAAGRAAALVPPAVLRPEYVRRRQPSIEAASAPLRALRQRIA